MEIVDFFSGTSFTWKHGNQVGILGFFQKWKSKGTPYRKYNVSSKYVGYIGTTGFHYKQNIQQLEAVSEDGGELEPPHHGDQAGVELDEK